MEENDELTPEERNRLQRASDLQVALDTTFGESTTNAGLDTMNPITKEEFEEFADALALKVQPLSKHVDFPTFAETIVRNICASSKYILHKQLNFSCSC